MQSLAGPRTSSTIAPTKNLDYEALDKLQDAIMQEHGEHGTKLVAGCRACIYRAAYKVQHVAPSERQAKAFLANVPMAEINGAIRDVSAALGNYEQVKEMTSSA